MKNKSSEISQNTQENICERVSSHENYWPIFFDVCKTGLYQRWFPENFLEFFGTVGTKYSRMDQLKFVEGSL